MLTAACSTSVCLCLCFGGTVFKDTSVFIWLYDTVMLVQTRTLIKQGLG